MTLRHASFFSGVGGLDLGFHRAGIRTVSLSEIDPYASAVLAERFPGVPNLGDITKIKDKYLGGSDDEMEVLRRLQPDDLGYSDADQGGEIRRGSRGDGFWDWRTAEIFSGGFPCQDLSVAGRRKGFQDGTRSSLAFTYLDLVERNRPRWVLLENVPGLFSSNGGRDFARLIREMVDLGYGLAWRTLDARFFGVAQRRRRVFILAARDEAFGDLGAERAAEVLFECEGECGHHQAGREARESSPETSRGRPEGDLGGDGGSGILGSTTDSDGVRGLNGMGEGVDDREGVEGPRGSEAVGFTKSSFGGYIPTDKGAGTLRAKGGDIGGGSETLAVSDSVLSFPSRFGSNANVTQDQAQSFAHSAGAPAVLLGTSYDGLNQKIEADGAHRTPRIGRDSSDFVIAPSQKGEDDLLPVGLDSHRYRCAGNGVVANVAEWIGRRIVAVDTKYASGTVAGYAVPEALPKEAE